MNYKSGHPRTLGPTEGLLGLLGVGNPTRTRWKGGQRSTAISGYIQLTRKQQSAVCLYHNKLVTQPKEENQILKLNLSSPRR